MINPSLNRFDHYYIEQHARICLGGWTKLIVLRFTYLLTWFSTKWQHIGTYACWIDCPIDHKVRTRSTVLFRWQNTLHHGCLTSTADRSSNGMWSIHPTFVETRFIALFDYTRICTWHIVEKTFLDAICLIFKSNMKFINANHI